jgi:hypothetical protein
MAISFIIGCKDDDAASALEGCCDTPAINGSVGNGHFYVANIITSNADGINDIVWPYSDQNIVLILSFQIRDKEGKLVYEVLNESPNDASKGWDGRIDGQWIEGVYNVRVQAEAADGTIGTLDGKVCNFRCRDLETPEKISADGCQFPTQVTDGHFDPTIPSLEQNDCFE